MNYMKHLKNGLKIPFHLKDLQSSYHERIYGEDMGEYNIREDGWIKKL